MLLRVISEPKAMSWSNSSGIRLFHLGEQPEQDFIELLPMLRRAFASFGASERKRLLAEVGKPRAAAAQPAEAGDSDAPGFAAALPLLLTILGISRHE